MAQTIKLKRSGTSGAVPTTSQLELGEVAINTYDGKMYIKKNVGGTETIVEIGSGATSADAIFEEYIYTATSGQTSFSGSDDNSLTLSYTAEAIQVFLNGVLLDPDTDYTATNGTTVVLASGATTSDLLQIFAFKKKIGEGQTTVDTFSGNNSTTAFTLSLDPGDENNTRVFIDGVYQSKSNYSVSGTTLTFSTAPPTGTAIEVEIGNRVVTLDTLSDLDLPDNVKLRLGTSQDLEIYHNATDSVINQTGTGDLLIQKDETTVAEFNVDGLTVTGDVEADEFIGDVRGAVLFKAQAGETLAKGEVVYISGISGNTTIVSKADADDTSKMPAFGLVAAAASSGNPVDIYTNGILSGIDTSSYSEGDELFVSTTAGTLTATAPTGESAALQKIGKVTRSASSGSIFIVGAGRSNAVPNLDDGDIFIGNASNQAVSASLNTKIESYLDGGTSTPTFSTINSGNITTTGELRGPATFVIDPAAVGDNTGTVQIKGNLQVDGTQTIINSTTLTVDDLNIVLASGAANATAANGAGITIDGASATLTYASSGDTWDFNKSIIIPEKIVHAGDTDTFFRFAGANDIRIVAGNVEHAAFDGTIVFNQSGADMDLRVESTGNENMLFVDSGNNRVGIGTNSPMSLLHLSATAPIISLTDTNSFTDANDRLIFRAGANEGLIQWYDDSGSSTSTIAVFESGGNVGIGTTSPSTALTVSGDFNATTAGSKPSITGTGIYGGGIGFIDTNVSGMYTDTSGANLKFFTNQSGSDTAASKVAMTINGSGQVGIGTASINSDSILHLKSTQPNIYFEDTDDSKSWRLEAGAVFKLQNITTSSEVFRIDQSDHLLINNTAYSSLGTVVVQQTADSEGIAIIDSDAQNTFFFENEGDECKIRNNSANPITFSQNAGERMRIDSSGNVGIGITTNLASKLHVNTEMSLGADGDNRGIVGYTSSRFYIGTRQSGTNYFDTISVTGGYVGIGVSDPDQALIVKGVIETRASNSTNGWMMYTYTDNSLRFNLNGAGADEIVVDSSGNVGIGEDTPLGKLHVKEGDSGATSVSSNFDQLVLEDDVHSGITILSGTSSDGAIYFGDSGGNAQGQIKYKHGSDSLNFTVNDGTEALIIDSSNNLLVGTTDTTLFNNTSGGGINLMATNRLDVARDGDVTATFNRMSSNGEIISFYGQGALVGNIGSEGGDSVFMQGGTTAGAGLLFHGGAAKILPVRNAASIDATIDLGQSSRRFKDLYLSGDLLFSDSSSAINNSGGELYLIGASNIRNRAAIHTFSNSAGSVEYMRIDSTGNILLNNGSPEFHFGTTSASHTNWRIACQEVVSDAFEIASGTQSAGSNALSDTYTTRFVVNSLGDIGISNTAPTNYAAYKTLHIGDGNTNNGGVLKFGTGATSNGPEIYAATDGSLRFNSNNATNVFNATSTGVGIGTASPAVKLHVKMGSGSTNPLTGITNYTNYIANFQTGYSTGEQNLGVIHYNGNWLDGSSGGDSRWGFLWHYAGSERAGIDYDHRSSEKFDFWSSYGPIRFRLPGSPNGNISPIDSESSMPEVLSLNPGGRMDHAAMKSYKVYYGAWFSSNSYLHLKTNVSWGATTQMYALHFEGHAYNDSKIIDAGLAFYNYATNGYPVNIGSTGTHSSTIYESSDGKIVIVITVSTYYQTLIVNQIRTAQGLSLLSITGSTASNSSSGVY